MALLPGGQPEYRLWEAGHAKDLLHKELFRVLIALLCDQKCSGFLFPRPRIFDIKKEIKKQESHNQHGFSLDESIHPPHNKPSTTCHSFTGSACNREQHNYPPPHNATTCNQITAVPGCSSADILLPSLQNEQPMPVWLS